MPYRLLRIIPALIAVLFLSACVSTYQKEAASAHHAYRRGDYERAVKLINKVKPARRDKLLHLLDQGIILHAAGKYEKSNKVLTQAEELSNALSSKSITRETAAALWSEEATEYAGERHERAMIPVIRMLNYIMLDEWKEARVEVRRLGYIVEKVYGREHDFDNAFAVYLSAMVWEALGNINDAQIDYKSLAKKNKQVPYYAYDLEAMSARLGLPVKLPPKSSKAWYKSSGYRKNDGELVLIAFVGRSPSFVADYMSTGMFTISVPSVIMYESLISHADVKIDGHKAGITHPFYNISDDILIALKERRKRSLVRKMVKVTAQTGLYAAGLYMMESDEVEQQIAGIALSLLAMSMAASDRADERSWRTLPASFQIGRFFIAPGHHEIEIIPQGAGTAIKHEVEIKKGKPKVLIVHLPESGSLARGIDRSKPAYELEAEDEEAALERRVRAAPRDGNLKIELAEARMRGGDYDVEGLLVSSIKYGGNEQRAIQDLVIAHTVKGQYANALTWAKKGAPKNRFAYYAEALEYLMDKRAKPPLPISSFFKDQKGLVYAFNYFIQALVEEKEGDYDDAAKKFAKAHELGLVGKPVAKKVISSYKKTDESFKNSETGVNIITEFADSFF